MISYCSFQNMTVPEIIRESRQKIAEYEISKDPDLLSVIRSCLEDGYRILNDALKAAGTNNQRISSIEKCRREIDELNDNLDQLGK